MQLVFCIAGTCPMRREPSHKSEMVNQLLFGELAEAMEEDKDFTKVKCLYDNYEGWCQNSQLAEVEAGKAFQPAGFCNVIDAAAMLNETIIHLPLAAPVYKELKFEKYNIKYNMADMIRAKNGDKDLFVLKNIALAYLNTPYLWGGKSSFGIDCSGFTQQVFKMMGVYLMRDACQQATQGNTVDFLQATVCGDLAFFDNDEGYITHTGILLNNEKIIHASGYVKIDRIDSQGIINSITGKRTQKLRIIKRLL